MMRNVGLIGAGNMGSAILRGVIDAGYIKANQVCIYDASESRMNELDAEFRQALTLCESVKDLVDQCDMIILAVKPYILGSVMEEIAPVLDETKCLISIAAGWTVAMLRNAVAGTGAAVLRVMPNTPALVGEGMTALCEETDFNQVDFDFAKGIFDSVGRTVVLPERLFDGVIAISGSSPAYVYMMIEAMADAGVKEGLPRKTAYEMAAQAVLGSALMVLNSGEHPGALKDAVCSPGGTTIEAVIELERKGFRGAVMDAMNVCAQKSRDMSK